MSNLSYNVQSWHGTTISIERSDEKVTIRDHSLLWPFEVIIWFLPFVIISFLWEEFSNWVIGQIVCILILGLFFLGLINDYFYPIISYYMKSIIIIHKYLGILNRITFLKDTTNKSVPLPENTYLISDVFAIGFQGMYEGVMHSLKGNQYSVAHIVILLNNHQLLNVGGWHGYFFTATKMQKRELKDYIQF